MKRTYVWICGFATVAASCVNSVGTQPDSPEDEVGTKTAALIGETGACLDVEVPRTEIHYPFGRHSNMQVFSADLEPEQYNWPDRTDCAAMIVDWVPDFPAEIPRAEAAFVSGILAPNVSSGLPPSECDFTRTFEKIVVQSVYREEGDWDTFVDRMKVGCGQSNESVPWIGSTDGGTQSWFRTMTRVRAITQSFVYTFPSAVSAYMQTERDDGCSGTCCYGLDMSGC